MTGSWPRLVDTAGKVMLVAKGNLLGNLLDKPAAVVMFVLPLVMTGVVGLIMADFQRIPVGVVVEGQGPRAARLVESLEDDPSLAVHRYDDHGELERGVRQQVVLAGIVVPEEYDRELTGGERIELPFVVDQSRPYPVAARSLVANRVQQQATELETVAFASEHAEVGFGEAARAVAEVRGGETAAVDVRDVGGNLQPDLRGEQFSAPASLLLFTFMSALGFAGGMVVTRQLGCERRMLASPTPMWVLQCGDFVGRLALSLVQSAGIVVMSRVVFGVRWGELSALVPVLVLFAMVSVAAAELVGALATSREQAMALSGGLGLSLGFLGGCVWPLAVVGPRMREVAHLFPHAWAIDAALAVGGGATLAQIGRPLAALAGYAAVLLVVAHLALRRRARRAVAHGV